MRGEQFATMWRTFGECVANGLQQCGDIRRIRGEQFATMWRTFGEYVANELQQCNIQKTKTILL